MSQSLIVLDTNVALYYLGGRLINPLPEGQYFVSVITEIELLSYPSLSFEQEVLIRVVETSAIALLFYCYKQLESPTDSF